MSFRDARTTPNFQLPVPADEAPADTVTDLGKLADAIDLIVQRTVHRPGDLIASFASSRPDALLCDGRLITGGVSQYPALAANCPLLVSGVDIRLPDLRGCAIIGAGAGVGPLGGALTNRAVGGKWGSETPTLPAHAHGINFESQIESGAGHQHYTNMSVSGATGGANARHTHTFYGGQLSVPVATTWAYNSGTASGPASQPYSSGGQTAVGSTDGDSPDHAHSVSASGAAWSGQRASGQMQDHTHTINGNTYNSGSDATGTNLQPSVAANIFIKT